jgi:hypothetical protein
MDLLDRYLYAVKFWLPRAQQEDILAELSEDLRSQIEDREAELGHPLDETEIAAILRKRGRPMLVASRYLPQQYLIGPGLLPSYGQVMRLVLVWMLPLIFIVIVGPAVFLTSAKPWPALLRLCLEFPRAAITAFGVITLVFALMEKYQVHLKGKIPDNWDPRRLPQIPLDPSAQPLSRCAPITDLVMGVVWSAALVYAIWFSVHL